MPRTNTRSAWPSRSSLASSSFTFSEALSVIEIMISITESASEKVKELLASEDREGQALRVFVRGMSCSGPAYGMALDDSTRPDDTIAEVFGVKIVVDPASAQ